MTRLLIKHCHTIMTGLAGDLARHRGHDILVEDGTITAIGDLDTPDNTPVLDAQGCIAYPGWVNTHHHLFQSLLKGEAGGLNQSLGAWLAATPYRYRAAFDEQTFRIAARVGLVELLRSGCTTVADHHYLYWPGMPFDSADILFEEASALGIRFVLCRGGATQTRGLEENLPQALRPEKFDSWMADMQRLTHRYHQASETAMRQVVMAPTSSLHSTTPEQLRECADLARRCGIRLHSHLSETVDYLDAARSKFAMTPVEFCAEYGWTGPDVWFAHLVKLLPEEIALLGATGTGIAHCPQSNGRLGSGIADIIGLEQAGVKISLGVDGAGSNEAADMISETHAAWLMQRARKGMLATPRYDGGQWEGGGDAATVEDVIRWGTSGGAAVLGLNGTGSLAPGMAADIALYQLDDPRYFGLHDPAIAPVASGGRAALRALLCAGRVIMENDTLAGVDLAQLGRDAASAVLQLQTRAGLRR
ncbi:amidohydrolase [Mangrovibacter sp. MFB070]|uniref:amidohydrolase family protein n=1 Tax=Mangrovibacter sp. MFB070 TaxID=1224318 RepID=UPI0004D80C13|nr:amidohydrolase family protein [Mangrovibacter sp. MFB070]KEA51024.1 amidohydrolase [Mangrovibacter sp. MFB070]